jgi:hypothetical protein
MNYKYQKLQKHNGCWVFTNYYDLKFGDIYRVLTESNAVCVEPIVCTRQTFTKTPKVKINRIS